MLPLTKLVRNSLNDHIDPELFYRSFIEMIFLTITISGILTFVFNPSYYQDNFSMNILGCKFCVFNIGLNNYSNNERKSSLKYIFILNAFINSECDFKIRSLLCLR